MSYYHNKTAFESGDIVEVGSKEIGFWGSYYKAKIVRNFGDNYVVEYNDLLENDGRTLYKDTVPDDDVRPLPPRKEITKLRYGDQVDVFHNDGWWAGIVTGKREGCYSVFFETSWEHIEYPISKLRPHFDWVKGRWYLGENVAYLFDRISVPPVEPLMLHDRKSGNSGTEGGDQDDGKNVNNKRVRDDDEEISRPMKIRIKLVSN